MTKIRKIIFETERLLLRQQVLEDLEELWAFHCNPQNVRYYQDAPGTFDEVRQQLEWDMNWYQESADLGTWAILHKVTGKLVGLCSLMPWTVNGIEEVEMSYILAEECRGQGLGTELSQAVIQYGFEKLKLIRIISLIEPENMLSRHVVEKVGMRVEGEGQDVTGKFLVYAINQAGNDHEDS